MDRRHFIKSTAAGASVAGLPGSLFAGDDFDDRMAWWREARFGMFIHWGMYAVLGRGEWVRNNEMIPANEYDRIAEDFNPALFDAKEWARVAKRAGMKYMVITAKHHDGFSMFDSKLTDYDIVDATPFGRDPMKELAEAYADEGIRFGFYYSQLDWHWSPRPNQLAYIPRFKKYFEFMKGQVEELMTNYGPLGSMFFDGEWMPGWRLDMGREIVEICRRHQPGLVINDRVGRRSVLTALNFYIDHPPILRKPKVGDYCTPEQVVPEGVPDADWETCMTMNHNWGYNRDDDNWKPAAEMIRKLVDIIGRGGNFLLNVGPDELGVIPPPSVSRLAEIGDWLEVNGEAIHGTEAGPIQDAPWGRSTRKDNVTYLHLFDWPDGELVVEDFDEVVSKAYLLADAAKTPLPIIQSDDGLVITLPEKAPSQEASVIAVE